MQRLPSTPEGQTESIGFRLPPPLLAIIDREVDALRAASPAGVSVTRSTALRALLVELEQRRAAAPSRGSPGPSPGERIAAAAADVRRTLAEMDANGAELRRLLEEGAAVAPLSPPADAHIAARADALRIYLAAVATARVDHAAAIFPMGQGEVKAPAVAHTAAGGQLSLLTRTANDGAEALSLPRTRARASTTATTEVLDALKPRLEAAHAAGHSLKTLGRESGVDPAGLSRWVSRERAGISSANASKLGAHLERLGF